MSHNASGGSSQPQPDAPGEVKARHGRAGLARFPSRKSREKGASIDRLNSTHRGDLDGRLGRPVDPLRRGDPPAVSPREAAPGALNRHYDIPTVTIRQKPRRGVFLTCTLIAGVLIWRIFGTWNNVVDLPVFLAVIPVFLLRLFGWLISWRDQPVQVSQEEQAVLDKLNVVVSVPVYNEDSALLDRCLYALLNQSRPPQRIDVIDDCSAIDYSVLRDYWARTWPCGTTVRWHRQLVNQGKRRAHFVTFTSAPEADIFITVDSDTTAEHRAIGEGLQPFRDSTVMSVAGVEMGFNAYENLLTRAQATGALYAQVVIGAAWSVMGNMYTNRGPFAAYRATMIREIVDLYANETIFGHRVILGDDSLLALLGGARGKSVQQLSSIGLTMWPEKLGHHLRQRLRWARGRTVRNFWRARYYPLNSYIYWFTFTSVYTFLISLGLLIETVVTWPEYAHTAARVLLALYTWNAVNQLRVLCFHRSDENWLDRVFLVILRPLWGLWASIVLSRLVRAWGTATFLKQGWTTRQQGAELVLTPVSPDEEAA